MAVYRLTAARRAALRKAQLASARKRRGRKRVSRKAKAGLALGVVSGGVIARHKVSKSSIRIVKQTNPVGPMTGKVIPPHGWQFSRGRGYTEYNPSTQYKTRKGVLKGRDFRDFSVSTPKRGPLGNTWHFDYQHNNLFGRKVKTGVRSPVDRDAIPLYNRKAQKPWPHVTPEVAREQNRRARSAGAFSSSPRRRKRRKKK